MSTSLLELKGTAEEIQKRLDDSAGVTSSLRKRLQQNHPMMVRPAKQMLPVNRSAPQCI